MSNINITPIAQAVVVLIAAIITTFVVPWIKSKVNNEDMAIFLRWVDIAVAAAEQLYESTDGTAKKEYVLAYLRDKGYTVDVDDLENAIEAAVLKLHKELYGGANNAEQP